MYYVKFGLPNDVTSWRSCSFAARGCVNRIRLLSPRSDDHSGVLIGAGWTPRFDWPACVLADDISTRLVDCTRAGASGS